MRRSGDEWVVELGGGTGVISRALLAGGVPAERLAVVEIVPSMASHLRAILPGVEVIAGDARALPELLPHLWHDRIGTVICGIPLVLLPVPEQPGSLTPCWRWRRGAASCIAATARCRRFRRASMG